MAQSGSKRGSGPERRSPTSLCKTCELIVAFDNNFETQPLMLAKLDRRSEFLGCEVLFMRLRMRTARVNGGAI
jgi:hypothetical protein